MTGSSWQESVDAVHRSLQDEHPLSRRLRLVVARLVGRPYQADTLIGGPDRAESLVVRLDRFDCVTFIETSLALAVSRSSRGFRTQLLHTRYRGGRVHWRSRLHYFSDWMVWNEKRGLIRRRRRDAAIRVIDKKLAFIEALPARQARLHVVPKKKMHLVLPRITDGTVVAFASLRARLDFFHTGIVFWRFPSERSPDTLMLYNARRKAGRVVALPLLDFLREERMRGVAFAELGN